LLEAFDEVALGGGGHVESVDHPAAAKVLDERVDDRWVVVAVVEGTGAGEEVEVATTVFARQLRSVRRPEDGGPGAAVSADLRLEAFERLQGESVLRCVVGDRDPVPDLRVVPAWEEVLVECEVCGDLGALPGSQTAKQRVRRRVVRGDGGL